MKKESDSWYYYYLAFVTIVGYEIARFMRIWTQTLLPSAITMMLYFVVFGGLIGSRISSFSDHSYIEFIAPGLIMMAVITNTYANVSSSFFTARFQNSLDELLVAPVPSVIILFGYVSGGMLRGLLVGLAVTIIAFFYTSLGVDHLGMLFSIVLLTTMVFSLAGFFNAVFAKRFDDISFIPTFVLTPLIYLGGVFYSVDILSPFWHSVSLFNPILYVVNTFRYSMLGVSDVPVGISFIVLAGLAIVLFYANIYLLEKSDRIRK